MVVLHTEIAENDHNLPKYGRLLHRHASKRPYSLFNDTAREWMPCHLAG
ncbi:hypothetical protein BASA_1680 [Bifidobacterium animalis subsp. animalis]|nr:hypothetical protein BASA_1680 [Bifidobacterium animalis subsp. animalis]